MRYLLLGLMGCLIAVSVRSHCDTPSVTQRHGDAVRHPWTMHRMSDEYLIANSMAPADVDQDGFVDFAVIDESTGLQTILFHPGRRADLRDSWPRIVLGKTGNPEYSCLGDLDGDGAIDFVVVKGDDLQVGLKTGVRVIWGPSPERARDASAWTPGGRIPGCDGQQYLYAECRDINGDSAVDIVVGGRRHAVTKRYAGIRWIEAPRDPKRRRDLRAWKVHFIDRDARSGHAWTWDDIDQDGDSDLVDANADWDTSEYDEALVWYENPGPGTPTQRRPWKRHNIWASKLFYAKPQVAVGDLNGDGRNDLATQTQNHVHVFLKTGVNPVTWQRISIRKPLETQWIGRPIRFADIDGDGQLDIVAMLIHNDGSLPFTKASVFWMEWEGDALGSEWRTHPIKWSDGCNTYDQWIGEKWDHCIPMDIDGDGDIDIAGNVEEHYYRDPDGVLRSHFSVVWFENPTRP